MSFVKNPVDVPDTRQRLQAALILASRLQGHKDAFQARHRQLVKEVGAAKARMELGSEVARVFEALQHKAHERSVGAFERLLTAILRDVMPDEGTVRLVPEYKNNSTWLDILLEKDGSLEDILDGNGGAVTNILCAGLRFAALSRTNNRRVMVLDEPDCWLKPDLVPEFVRVIAQVSLHAKTQTFFVSHHDPAFFEGFVNVVKFERDETGRVQAVPVSVLADWTSDDQPGIRSIELTDFRTHEKTRIPCYPGATAFIGDNNLGKSAALVRGFRAMAYNESDETIIRHGAQSAHIAFCLEGGVRLEYTRFRKKSPAVLYALFEGDSEKPVKEGRPRARSQAPEWVEEILGVTRVDDLDIQIGNQKNPVFLLDDTASRRAQILSVGKESGYLRALMKKYEGFKDADREVIKQGETELAAISYRMGVLDGLTKPFESLGALLVEADDTLGMAERIQQIDRMVSVIEAHASKVGLLSEVCVTCEKLQTPPLLGGCDELEGTIRELERTRRRTQSGTGVPSEMPAVPVLMDVAALSELGARLVKVEKTMLALKNLPETLPVIPSFSVDEGLASVLQQIGTMQANIARAQELAQSEESQLNSAVRELERTKAQFGGVCPLCDAPMHGATEDHYHV